MTENKKRRGCFRIKKGEKCKVEMAVPALCPRREGQRQRERDLQTDPGVFTHPAAAAAAAGHRRRDRPIGPQVNK